jgi:hypothetical protein
VRGSHLYTVVLLGACAALVSGCGGGTRQDAGEPDETFTVAVAHASFPTKQSIVRPATMTLAVHNSSDATMPNVAVTVDSFDYASDYPNLADNQRPVWVIEEGPGVKPQELVKTQTVSPAGGGQTAYVNTWALGSLAAGQTRTFVWHVTPVKPGTYTVHYTIAAGLAGRSRARLADGAIPRGQFTVAIAPRPPATHVNPETGRVEPGAYPSAAS